MTYFISRDKFFFKFHVKSSFFISRDKLFYEFHFYGIGTEINNGNKIK
jgi:hypothetical protein